MRGFKTSWLVLALGLAGFANAQTVEWNTDSAVLAGNGCSQDDSYVEASGKTLWAVFFSFAAEAGGDAAQAARSSCTVRVPVTLPAGMYVRGARLRLGADYDKDSGSTGAVAYQVSVGTARGGDSFKLDAEDSFFRRDYVISRAVSLSNAEAACRRGGGGKTLVGLNLALSAQGSPEARSLIDIGQSLEGYARLDLDLASCPL